VTNVPRPDHNQDDDDDDDDVISLTKRPRLPVDKAYTIKEPPSKQPWDTVYPWAQAMVKVIIRQAHDAKQPVTFM
jgi:hypothetical protein